MEEELDRVLYLSFSPFAVKGVLSIKYFRYYICINIKEGGLITYLSRCSKLNNWITINLRLYLISAEILARDQMWWALKLIIFEIWWVKTQVNELLKTFLRRCRYIYLENIYAFNTARMLELFGLWLVYEKIFKVVLGYFHCNYNIDMDLNYY